MADAKLQTRIRREQIAEAALHLVASEGVKRLSIAAVARRVGLVPSDIYRHFKSKDAMLDAVLDLLDAKLQANVEAARKETADPLRRLHGLFLRHIRFIREGQAFPRIMFSDEALAARPERKSRVGRIMGDYLGEVERMVREGQQQGQIDRQLLPRTAAMLFGNDHSGGRSLAPDRRRLQSHAACGPGLEDVSAGPDGGGKVFENGIRCFRASGMIPFDRTDSQG